MKFYLSENLLVKIGRDYALKKSLRYKKFVKGGYSSHNSIIQTDTGETFFLKQYKLNNPDTIRNTHLASSFISKGGIPVILPLVNCNNESFFEHEGNYYALFPFVKGRSLAPKRLTEDSLMSFGKTLGEIHILTKDSLPEIGLKSEDYWDKDNFMEESDQLVKIITTKKKMEPFDELALELLEFKKEISLRNRLEGKDLKLGSTNLIHGDYHEANVFFDQKRDVVKYVYDLEQACFSPRLLELVRAVDLACLINNYTEEGYYKARIVFNSYINVYPVENSEEIYNCLVAYTLKQAHCLWIETEHYLYDNSRVDHFLNSDLGLLKYYSENTDRLMDEVYK